MENTERATSEGYLFLAEWASRNVAQILDPYQQDEYPRDKWFIEDMVFVQRHLESWAIGVKNFRRLEGI